MYKVSVIGGGTGSFTILTGLVNYKDLFLSAIVNMFDDGGSTGILRDQLGALPPGDVRNCLIALADPKLAKIWREIFSLRYDRGRTLKGHSLGNLIISGLERQYGSFEKALAVVSELLKIRGEVVPVTLDNVKLIAKTPRGRKIIGEHAIDLKRHKIDSLHFRPLPNPNPKAISCLLDSDLTVISPGDLNTSIRPNLMVESIVDAINDSNAIIVYVCNIMTQKMHTPNFRVIDFVKLLEESLGHDALDFVIYNNELPSKQFLSSYALEGEFPVKFRLNDFKNRRTKFIGRKLVSQEIPVKVKGDGLERSLIRHNPYKVASILYNLLP